MAFAFCKGQANGGVKVINPSTSPGLKPGVCSGLILSGAFDPVLKDGVCRRRSIKVEGGSEEEKEVIVRHESVFSKWKRWKHDNFSRDWSKKYSV